MNVLAAPFLFAMPEAPAFACCMALLEARLTNDPATELRVTAGQLREIAALRLRGLVA